MPRPLRPIADGLIYHVINRGNNRQTVFDQEGDCLAFLKAMADLKERMSFELYGYCLMSNHIHLLIRPREGTISRLVQSLPVSHTQRYHRFHRTIVVEAASGSSPAGTWVVDSASTFNNQGTFDS